MSRIAIAGGPRTGKTTLGRELAVKLGVPLRHADDVIHLGWSSASAEVSEWFDDHKGPVIIEGVAVPRALRKWLARHETGRPVDLVIWMSTPFLALTPGQSSMAKGCETVWAEIAKELQARGVALEVRA